MSIDTVALRAAAEAQIEASLLIAWPESLPSSRDKMATAIADAAVACANAVNTEAPAGSVGAAGVVQLSNGSGSFAGDSKLHWDTGTSFLTIIGQVGHDAYGAPSNYINLRRANGTVSVPTIVANNDVLGEIRFHAHNGSSFFNTARITAEIDGTTGAADLPTRLRLWTTPDGSTTPVERMRITNNGLVGIGTSTVLGGIVGNLHLITDLTGLGITQDAYGSSSNYHIFRRANGTAAVPTIVANNDVIGEVRFYAYDSTDFVFGSRITAEVDGTPGAGDMPTRIRMWTSPDGFTGSVERLRITNGGTVGIGTSALPSGTPLPTLLHLASDDGSLSDLTHDRYSATTSWGPYLLMRRARGTRAAPTNVADGDYVGSTLFRAYFGGSWYDTGMIVSQVDGTPGASDMPGRLVFFTTPDGSSSIVERMRITNGGFVGIGDTAPQTGALATPSKLSILRPTGVWGLTIEADVGQQADMLLWKPDNTADHRIIQLVLQTDTWMLRRVTDAGSIGQYFLYCNTTNGAIGVNTDTPNTTSRLHIFDASTYYALVLEADATPTRAALRIVPQDADPSTALAGDVYWRADALRERRASAWARVRDPVLAATMLPAGTSQTVDWNNGESQTLDLGSATGTVAVTMTNGVAGQSYVLKVIQDNSVARNLSWTTTVRWRGGTIPTITATLLAVDIITLYYDGTNWYGNIGQAYA